jgi:hypothetical protein
MSISTYFRPNIQQNGRKILGVKEPKRNGNNGTILPLKLSPKDLRLYILLRVSHIFYHMAGLIYRNEKKRNPNTKRSTMMSE